MDERLEFPDRKAFRTWLEAHGQTSGGVWLLFGRPGGPKTLKAGEALEEALCFGWIDGRLERIDETCYRKYFAPRRAGSRWSAKNRVLAERLAAQGLMTPQGLARIEEAKANGRWDAPDGMAVGEEEVAHVSALLEVHAQALANFQAMPPSVRKTYARAYFDAKTDAGRTRRLAWLVDRLNKNLRPMERS